MPTPGRRAPTRARRSTPETRLRRKAQAMSKLALETLEAIMKGEAADTVRLAAAREVLDRGHGRPKLGEPQDAPEGLTVILKRYSDISEAEEAEADA